MLTDSDGSASFTSGGIFFRGVRADAAFISDLRRAVRVWLEQLDVDDDRKHDVVLASYEALANAVEHAYDIDDDSASLDFEATYLPQDQILEVRVADHGCWHDADSTPTSRGHGLALIRGLATDVVVDPTPQGTHVTIHWSL
ncbi:ATP-binding protein [Rhodococcus coprophilus]|uniref:Anti sigma factor n=1 Tax=Rhodococcus coprophilus TaxID=38310 RepID=A0A2X4U5B6_9NOCA|nr:ATP-binding protein [Rhodococcus coprophilus]MBM7457747.1 serine/threonine-protein kinase RsbW [Rhodococcus coprophilus]SQI30368.1 anti sigma factor [Rhodococcus coprophilus]